MLYTLNLTVCSVEGYIFFVLTVVLYIVLIHSVSSVDVYIFFETFSYVFITPKTVSSIVWMLTLNFTVGSVICGIFISVR